MTFWSAALDAKEEPLRETSSQVYRKLRLPDSDVRILLQRTADPKAHKERMHLDLETDDVEAEVRRLEALSATRYDHQQERGYDFWVLRDPWANEFCVLQINFPDLLAQTPTLARSRHCRIWLFIDSRAGFAGQRRVSSPRCGPRRDT